MNATGLARLSPQRWPIAVKLSTTLLAVALLPMGLTTYFNLRESLTDIEAAAYNNIELLAVGRSAQLDQLLLDHRQVAEYLATDPLLIDFLKQTPGDRVDLRGEVETRLARLQGLDPHYALVYLIDNQGKGAAAPNLPSVIGDNLKFRDYFQVPQQMGQSYISSLLVGTNTNVPGVYFSAPVQSETGEFLGVAVIKMDGELIWKIVDESGSEEEADASEPADQQGAFLIDQAGIVIAHPNRDWLYQSLGELSPAVEAEVVRDRRYAVDEIPSLGLDDLAAVMVNASVSGYAQYQLPDQGQSRITGYAPLQNQDWVMGISQPESAVVAAMRGLAIRSYLALGVAAIGAAGLSIVLIRTIVRPIRDLTLAVTKVQQGRFEFVASDRQDELGTLARAFNHMEQRLQRSFYELAESKALLAQRVEERTAELSQTLAQLRQTQAQMIQQEKLSSLGELVAGVAHEINNPVNFIHGNLTHAQNYLEDLLGLVALYRQHYPEPAADIEAEIDAIELDFLEEDLRKLLASMAMGTDRIRHIVLSLRNFARMDEAECKDVDLHEGLDSTLLILQHRLKATPTMPAIQVQCEYGTLPLVECYPSQLNQVFMNLMSNAIDALVESYERPPAANGAAPLTASASATPTLTIRTRPLGADWVEVAIADNGKGIPAEVGAKIFDPFFTTKPVGQGTGMGLSISFQIVTQRHHGRLTYRSPGEGGTEFTIQLPVQLTPPPTEMMAAVPAIAATRD